MKYSVPTMQIILFCPEDDVLSITMSQNTTIQMQADWTDGFEKT